MRTCRVYGQSIVGWSAPPALRVLRTWLHSSFSQVGGLICGKPGGQDRAHQFVQSVRGFLAGRLQLLLVVLAVRVVCLDDQDDVLCAPVSTELACGGVA